MLEHTQLQGGADCQHVVSGVRDALCCIVSHRPAPRLRVARGPRRIWQHRNQDNESGARSVRLGTDATGPAHRVGTRISVRVPRPLGAAEPAAAQLVCVGELVWSTRLAH